MAAASSTPAAEEVVSTADQLISIPFKIEVGPPLINFDDGHYAVSGKSKVIAYQAKAISFNAPAASPSPEPSPEPSVPDVKKSLYGVVIAECVVGVLILAVAGYVYTRYRKRRSTFGRGAGKPSAFTPNGLPVWEMGQWRVIRAEDWAAMKKDGDDQDDDYSEEEKDEKDMDTKIKIED
ncbi:hypothetical protein HDU67_003979, partial [Dinochytrium kinnereticum]